MLRKLHGTGHRPIKNEPVAPDGEALIPAEIAACPIASKYWTAILRDAPRNVLKRIDMPLVARLAISLATSERAIAELRSGGYVTVTSNGTAVQSPWMGIYNRSVEIARKLSAELALPPTARARLDMPAPPPPVPIDNADSEPDDMTLDEFLMTSPRRSLQ